jgi:predicted XRE-type DNA-binding protein
MTMKVQVFDSVWNALEETPAEAANLRLRADLMIALRAKLAEWDITQVMAAERLGISQPRLSDLLRGRIDRFSLDALVILAAQAGLVIRLEIRTAA